MRPLPSPASSTSPQRRAAASETPQQPVAHDGGQGPDVDQAAALGVFRRLGMTAPGAAAPPEDPAQAPHHLRDAGAAGSGPPRQLGTLDDGRPGLPDGSHAFAVLRQADQVAALTDPPFSRKPLTAFTFSDDSAGGLPPVLPSAAARSTPALIRSRMVSRSHSARDSSIWSMRRDVGLSSPVSSPSVSERMLIPWP